MKRILVVKNETEYQKLLKVLNMSSEQLMSILNCDVDLDENIIRNEQSEDMFITMKLFFE